MNLSRMYRLRNLLESLPETQINMAVYAAKPMEDNHWHLIAIDKLAHESCGTAACICGWTLYLFGDETIRHLNPGGVAARYMRAAADLLDLPLFQAKRFFLVEDWRPVDDEGCLKDLDQITKAEVLYELDARIESYENLVWESNR